MSEYVQCSAVVVVVVVVMVMVLPTHKTENINLCSSGWCLYSGGGPGSCSQGRPCAGAGNYHTGMCHKMIVNPDTADAWNEGYAKVCEDFTTTEKAAAMASEIGTQTQRDGWVG